MQNLATAQVSAPLDGSTRELARFAMSDDWSVAKAMEIGEDVDWTLTAYEGSMIPLADADPKFTSKPAQDARDWLKPIGMKISPTMSAEQCGAWLTAVMMALSDFPAKVIIQASRAAIRRPMNFLNEVDGHVRAEAETLMNRHRNAMFRLKMMQDQIRYASMPKPELVAPAGYENGTVPEMSLDELRATARSAMGSTLMRMGLNAGYIAQAHHDLVMAEIAAEAADDAKQ